MRSRCELSAAHVTPGKISPQLAGIAARIIRTSGWFSFRTRVAIPARSRKAWNSRMGLFHHMTDDDGIEDGNKTPSSTVGCRGK